MAKTTPLGVRISEETKAGLAKAAKDDMRSMASLIEKILVEWLREKGYAQEPPEASPTRRRKSETTPKAA
jgi:hypothetical protein